MALRTTGAESVRVLTTFSLSKRWRWSPIGQIHNEVDKKCIDATGMAVGDVPDMLPCSSSTSLFRISSVPVTERNEHQEVNETQM